MAGVVGTQVQADAEADDIDGAGATAVATAEGRDHRAQVVVEVVAVVGQVGGAVRGAAVGDHHQQAAIDVCRHQALAGPLDRFTVYPFLVQVGLEQGGEALSRASPRLLGVLEDQMARLVKPSRRGGAPGLEPVALGSAAVPGGGGEAQHLAVDAGHVQRPGQQLDQHGDGLAVGLHRAGAVDQQGHLGVADRTVALAPKDAPLLRGGDDLGQPAAVDDAAFLAVLPAIAIGHRQVAAKLTGQTTHIDLLGVQALVQARPILFQLGLTHQAVGLALAVVGGGEGAITMGAVGQGAALAGGGQGHLVVELVLAVEQQCQRPAWVLGFVLALALGLVTFELGTDPVGDVAGVTLESLLVVALTPQSRQGVAQRRYDIGAGRFQQVLEFLEHGRRHQP